jgi:uncharacterized membrane protein
MSNNKRSNKQSEYFNLAVVLVGAIVHFIVTFSYSLQRLNRLWASYFDLGIMHQTVWNTYRAIQTLEFGRLLELTDPHGSGNQIYRMAIHADYFLAFIAPLYFFFPDPKTLLFTQSFMTASGGISLYFLTREIFRNAPNAYFARAVSLILPFLYYFNFAVLRANYYEFHAVTLATPLILWMVYCLIKKNYFFTAILIMLVLSTKEHAGFSISVFFGVLLLQSLRSYFIRLPSKLNLFAKIITSFDKKNLILLFISFGAFAYVVVTVFVLMPVFRGGSEHFALNYFSQSKIHGSAEPSLSIQKLVSTQTFGYVLRNVGPLAFTPFLTIFSLPALPDILINLLSSNHNMRNFYYHYTAVITPWMFIGSIYALRMLSRMPVRVFWLWIVLTIMILNTMYHAYLDSPLPFSTRGGRIDLSARADEYYDVLLWQRVLADDKIKVSSTGQLAPYLSGRRYFYNFGSHYTKSDYVALRKNEVYDYSERNELIPMYEQLVVDGNYSLIYKRKNFEVFKRIPGENK